MFDISDLNFTSWEFAAASVILVFAVVVVFMLLRIAVLEKTLQETHELQKETISVVFRLLGITNPRALLEMDLPPEFQAVAGGETQN